MRVFSKHGTFWLSLIVFAAVIVFVLVGTAAASHNSAAQTEKSINEAVTRAVVECYAIEGAYPPDFEYLEDHYGITVDHSQYIVHYNAFAQNIMPEIKVIKK